MTDLITTVTATAALVFGFALCCVIGVVYLLSKRQINVVQNNSTSVTATERTDSGAGGPGHIERFLIKWVFIGLLAAIVVVTLANAFTASFPAQRASIGNAQPAPLPTVAAPAALLPATLLRAPSPVGEGWGEGLQGREGVSPLSIIVPVLAVIALGLWAYIVRAWYSLRQQRYSIRHAQPTSTQREQHLNDIIPDVVNEL